MKKKRLKLKKSVLYILMFIFILGIIISGYNIITYQMDKNNIDEELSEINDLVTIEEVPEIPTEATETETVEVPEKVEIIEQKKEVPKANPYWDYIKMKLINVNFTELKKTNKDVRGWITVNGTKVNYPFVQAKNNTYYLTKSFNKKYNRAGWVFLDYRNNISDFKDKNTIIYAHGMRNQTMFGSLRKIETNGWLKNKDNFVIKLSTEYENTLWQVFSVYHIPTTNDYIKVKFSSDKDFLNFIDTMKKRSSYDFKTDVQAEDRILTLSTCYTHTVKLVIHAKLIKREQKQDV